MKSIVENVSVVNDPAERAIGLMKSVNNTLSKDLTQQNYILQVIENYRQHYNGHTKHTFYNSS